MPTLHLTHITCVTTEDDTGPDESKIEVNGEKVWQATMNDGDSHPMDVNVNFTDSAEVKLVDEDWPDSDDVLGKQTVTSGSGTMEFGRDGANYKVSYWVSS
jgi:hypothetical protein